MSVRTLSFTHLLGNPNRDNHIKELAKKAASYELANFTNRYYVTVETLDQEDPNIKTHHSNFEFDAPFQERLTNRIQDSFDNSLRAIPDVDLDLAIKESSSLWPKKSVSVEAHLDEVACRLNKKTLSHPLLQILNAIQKIFPLVVRSEAQIDENIQTLLPNRPGEFEIRLENREWPSPIFIHDTEVEDPNAFQDSYDAEVESPNASEDAMETYVEAGEISVEAKESKRGDDDASKVDLRIAEVPKTIQDLESDLMS